MFPGEQRRNRDRMALLGYLSSPECKLFSEAHEVKAVASDLDSMLEEGGNVADTIDLLRDMDSNRVKCQNFLEVIPELVGKHIVHALFTHSA